MITTISRQWLNDEEVWEMPQLVIKLPDFDIDASEPEKFIAQFLERAKPLIKKSITAWLEEYVARHLELQIQNDFFEMSFEKFSQLTEEEQWQIRQRVFEEKKAWIAEQLKAHQAEWMLVVGGQIERTSSTLDDLPTKTEVYKIGEAKGFAPYVFVRDALIEEIANSPWTQVSEKDYYPTIQVFVGKQEWDNEKLDVAENVLIADFDTGSPVVVLDKDELVEHEWIEDKEIGIIGSHLGRTYGYFLPKLKLGCKTASGEMKSGVFRVRAVRNWKESSFCQINIERRGLIGRNVLIELLLHLLLEGDEKKTVILK
ncbi:hypothetical protein FJZ31_37830 [Candidatus Poribacteria bacterium]|nr:hypothetical protein [Candidatus Poribacteria bacterium]